MGGNRQEGGGGGPVTCEADGTPTQLRCAKCARPICPRCLVQTSVGFTCDAHFTGRQQVAMTPLEMREALKARNQPASRQPSPLVSMSPLIVFLAIPVIMIFVRMGMSMTGGSGPRSPLVTGLFGVVPLALMVGIALLSRRGRRTPPPS